MRAIPRSTCCRRKSSVFQYLAPRLAIVAALLLCRAHEVPAQVETDVSDVQTALAQWRERFDSIRVEYRIGSLRQLQSRLPDEDFSDDFLKDWGRHGRLAWNGSDRFVLDLAMVERGAVRVLRAWGSDGEISWRATGNRGTPDGPLAATRWAEASLHQADPRRTAIGTKILALTGLFDPERAVWIDEILSDTDGWSAGKMVEVNGHTCLELTRSLAHPIGNRPIERRIALDPARGYLPRQIRETVTAAFRRTESVYQVTEFQEVEPGFWFPRPGHLVHVGSSRGHP